MRRQQFYDWEKAELDKLTLPEVALQLHKARLELEKASSRSNVLYSEMSDLRRKHEKAVQAYEDQQFDVETARNLVSNLEDYINQNL